MSARRVLSVVLSLCLALVVQGVAQARVTALGCGSAPTHHAPAHHGAAPFGSDIESADLASAHVTPGHNHPCNDADAPPAQTQPCNMGGQCHPVSLSPLLSVPVSAERAPVTLASIVFVAPAIARGAPARVWRPPALA